MSERCENFPELAERYLLAVASVGANTFDHIGHLRGLSHDKTPLFFFLASSSVQPAGPRLARGSGHFTLWSHRPGLGVMANVAGACTARYSAYHRAMWNWPIKAESRKVSDGLIRTTRSQYHDHVHTVHVYRYHCDFAPSVTGRCPENTRGRCCFSSLAIALISK